MDIAISITDAHTMELTTKVTSMPDTTPFDTIDILHRDYAQANPDSFVNFVWNVPGSVHNPSFICGQPYNMKQDEDQMAHGIITEREYYAKWYPGISF